MLGSLTSFQMKENVNYVVKMAMVSKLKGKRYWKNDRQISEEEKTLVRARKEPRKEERKGEEGRKESRRCHCYSSILVSSSGCCS